MSEQTNWLYDRFAVLLAAAMDGNDDVCADVLTEVGRKEGHVGVYAICSGMANAVMQLSFPGVQRGDGTLTGDIAVVRQLSGAGEAPSSLWACRFIVAWMNGDNTRCLDMFSAAVDAGPDTAISNVAALIRIASDIARAKEAELS
jgi:hypothetical protein